jgi:hypothetical protein
MSSDGRGRPTARLYAGFSYRRIVRASANTYQHRAPT